MRRVRVPRRYPTPRKKKRKNTENQELGHRTAKKLQTQKNNAEKKVRNSPQLQLPLQKR
jgi:hypothetical protein